MELSERKKAILQAIIEDYIQTAEPVGSRTIAKKYNLGISSATIRNEMSDLEEMGFSCDSSSYYGETSDIYDSFDTYYGSSDMYYDSSDTHYDSYDPNLIEIDYDNPLEIVSGSNSYYVFTPDYFYTDATIHTNGLVVTKGSDTVLYVDQDSVSVNEDFFVKGKTIEQYIQDAIKPLVEEIERLKSELAKK